MENKPDIETSLIVTEQPTPMEIIKTAIASGMVVADMQALFDLQERYEKKEAEKAFIIALNKFKENPPTIVKDILVEFKTTSYKHADLAQVSREIGRGLMKNGISHRWRTDQVDGGFIKVTCILTHSEGHSEMTTLQGLPDTSGAKNAVQSIGSTVTYLERYTLLAATGVAVQGDDDDGLQGERRKVVDPEQLEHILSLIDETGSDTEKFCQVMKVNSLNELTNQQYGAAIATLNRKKNRNDKT